jgi:hypothetical protein
VKASVEGELPTHLARSLSRNHDRSSEIPILQNLDIRMHGVEQLARPTWEREPKARGVAILVGIAMLKHLGSHSQLSQDGNRTIGMPLAKERGKGPRDDPLHVR